MKTINNPTPRWLQIINKSFFKQKTTFFTISLLVLFNLFFHLSAAFEKNSEENNQKNIFISQICSNLDFYPIQKYHTQDELKKLFEQTALIEQYLQETQREQYKKIDQKQVKQVLLNSIFRSLRFYIKFNKETYRKAYSIEKISLDKNWQDPISMFFQGMNEKNDFLKDDIEKQIIELNKVLAEPTNYQENESLSLIWPSTQTDNKPIIQNNVSINKNYLAAGIAGGILLLTLYCYFVYKSSKE